MHVDAFLYDEETIDCLCEEGKMSRNFCLSCGSHKTAPMGNYFFLIKVIFIENINKIHIFSYPTRQEKQLVVSRKLNKRKYINK